MGRHPDLDKSYFLCRDKGGVMLIEYLAILIYVAIAVVFALFAIVASALLGPEKTHGPQESTL